MRREFPMDVQRKAWARCKKACEQCGIDLEHKRREYYELDHDIADWFGGKPTLENCRVLCIPCHDEKTYKRDIPAIAKSKRIIDKHNGVKIKSRGFPKREPQRTASRPIQRKQDAAYS